MHLGTSSSSDDSDGSNKDEELEFEKLNSSLLREVISMLDREAGEENNVNMRESVSSRESLGDPDLENAIMNLLSPAKAYSTPIQMDEDIIREVVRRTADASERALR